MKKIVKNNKIYIFPAALVVVAGLGLFNLFFSDHSQPLFNNLDDFVLFAQEDIKLEQEIQVSSGDIGSNGEIDIEKGVIINGNFFADEIKINKSAQINGNISFNELETRKETQIFGTKTTPISLPIANLPKIPDFLIGTQDFIFEGVENTLTAGNYKNVTLKKGSRLKLPGGIYNLSKLILRENSTIIFSVSTTVNIKHELKGQEKISILPDQNLKPDDLIINYQGKRNEDNNDNGVKPVKFGKNSFLNFKLLAPEAKIHIGETTTLRGQILAKKIKIEKSSVLSREDVFEEESDPEKVVEDEGIRFIVNEIVILLQDEATLADVEAIAELINGKITGFVPEPVISKIEVRTSTVLELNEAIDIIKNSSNPLIIEVVQNLVGDPIIQ